MIDIREVEDGVVLSVRVQPNAGRTGVSGEYGGRIKVAVTVPPEKGKANLAVIKVLTRWLGVKNSDIRIISGERSRDKEVFVRNIAEKDVHDLVSQLLD